MKNWIIFLTLINPIVAHAHGVHDRYSTDPASKVLFLDIYSKCYYWKDVYGHVIPKMTEEGTLECMSDGGYDKDNIDSNHLLMLLDLRTACHYMIDKHGHSSPVARRDGSHYCEDNDEVNIKF